MTYLDEIMLTIGVVCLAWSFRSVVGWVLVVILSAAAAQNVANQIHRYRRE